MTAISPDEEYIYNEAPEISVGEREWTNKIFSVFPALRNRNYQLYFIGQLVSLIGTWLQIVAEGWLVLKLTNSAFYVGLDAAAATFPTLLFSLFGGVIVDRFSKKKILIATQAASMTLAFILGILVVTNLINVWEIIVLAFLLGTVTAIDSPARQAFVVEMVGREDMASAISLNSGIFNGARVVGPSVAGFLIALIGIGGAFLVNAASYIAVIFALAAMKVVSIVHDTHPNALKAIRNGITYSFTHPVIRVLLIFSAVTSIFGWSYTTIMPVIAQNTFHVKADGLGYLYAATGLGALVGTILLSSSAKKISPVIFILGGNVIFSISLIIFSFVNTFELAMILLFFSGFGLVSQFSMINTTIQNMVEDKYRGRVMSIYTIMFLGFAPFGNLEIGFVSEHLGTGFAIRFGAVITLLFGLLVYFYRQRIRHDYHQYVKDR